MDFRDTFFVAVSTHYSTSHCPPAMLMSLSVSDHGSETSCANECKNPSEDGCKITSSFSLTGYFPNACLAQ
jgi:hypothetical protein